MPLPASTPTPRAALRRRVEHAPTDTFPSAGGVDPGSIRRRVETTLHEFLASRAPLYGVAEVALFTDALTAFLATGGKRVRPLLCALGWLAAGGSEDLAPMLPAAASLELFHTFALIHDDVMDHSDTRRGKPTMHHRLAAAHPGHPHLARLGVNAAILLGDLALGWSYELLHQTCLPEARLAAARPMLDLMRVELLAGQYLDLRATAVPTPDLDAALRIIEYKTARYTIERPLHLGVSLAGGSTELLDACTAFALPLGEAFQLGDDLLGVFGDPAVTGKSCMDDLREGKHTALIALALQQATTGQATQIHTLLGRPDLTEPDADTLRTILTDTGARNAVEQMIEMRHAAAVHALTSAPLPDQPRRLLLAFADTLAARRS